MIKVSRTPTEPDALRIEREQNGSYNIPEVVELLDHDFHKICYICGAYAGSENNIEHLRPHKQGKYPELKYAWNNLFLCCPNCNSIKTRKRFDQDVIDCCAEDPEYFIRQEIDNGRIRVVPQEKMAGLKRAQNTAALVDACFHSASAKQQALKCESRRDELKRKTIVLCRLLGQFWDLREANEDFSRQYDEIRDMLLSDSTYAGFMRTFVRDRLDMFPEFERWVTTEE